MPHLNGDHPRAPLRPGGPLATQNGSGDGPVHNGGDVNAHNSNEPLESDPCIDVGDVKPMKKKTFIDRYVSEVEDRTGLSRKGAFVAIAVVLFAVVLFIVVIALGAAWPRMPHKFRYPVCGDGACLRAAAQISENMNKSVSPCDNMWGAACGGWLKNHPLPSDKSIWNAKHELMHREAKRVRDLVATLPLPLHTATVEWKLKHFYEACLDVHNINLDMDRPLTKIISELVTTAYARRTRGAAYNYQPPNGNAINFENFQKTNQAEGFGQQQLPQQGLEPPQFAQGLPQIPQGLSQFPQGLPQFPQGLQPGLPQFPQGLQPGLPQFQQGLPQRVFQLPQGLPQIPQGIPQGLPQIPQGLPPQFPQGLPQRLPQIPQGLPQFPQNLPQLPQGLPQPPQGLIQLPQNVQPLPQNIPQLPQSLPKEFLQGLPQNLPQFPSPPELPKELPPQLPQNLPQGFPQDFPQFQQNLPQELPKVNVQIQEQVVSQQRLPLPANFNFGGLPQQQEVKIGGSPAPQVSFPPPPQFPEAAPQPAAQIPESFPSQINLNQGEAQFPTVPQQEAGGVLVTKHVYFHVAPEAPEEYSAPRNIPIAPVRRHYKIIFIKAPYGPSPTTPSIPVQPQDEEKTLVYVLVRKPEQQPEIVVPTPVPTQPSKPEVYFIRYKAAKDNNGPAPTAPLEENFNGYPIAEDVLKKGDGQPGILTQQQFDQIPQNIEQPISSGESSSVSFSRENEPASQYGPPAYKKKK